jgi:hypothetical protein
VVAETMIKAAVCMKDFRIHFNEELRALEMDFSMEMKSGIDNRW